MSFKAPGNTPPGREPDINLGLRLPHKTDGATAAPRKRQPDHRPSVPGRGDQRSPARFRAAIQSQVTGRYRKSAGHPHWEDVLFPAPGRLCRR